MIADLGAISKLNHGSQFPNNLNGAKLYDCVLLLLFHFLD